MNLKSPSVSESLFLAYHPAGNFCPRIPRRLRMKIIRAIVDHHCLSDDLLHTKAVSSHRQKSTVTVSHQGWEISCVIGMGCFLGIVVPPCLGNVLTAAGVPVMDVQRKESGSAAGRQSRDIGYNQNFSTLLIESHLTG